MLGSTSPDVDRGKEFGNPVRNEHEETENEEDDNKLADGGVGDHITVTHGGHGHDGKVERFPEADVAVKRGLGPVEEADEGERKVGQNHHQGNDLLRDGIIHEGCGWEKNVFRPFLSSFSDNEKRLHFLMLLSCMK